MRRPVVYLLIAVALLVMQLSFNRPSREAAQPFVAAPAGFSLIAHAGGGLPHGTYSNSLNAMDQAVAHGFALVEIDFSRTSDGKMVAIHDWRDSYFDWFEIPLLQQMKHRLGIAPKIPDLATFSAMEMRFDQEQADLADVMEWLKAHPEVRIVTDVKEGNVAALQEIAQGYPALIAQIIPQIYDPKEYDPVIAMGWTDVIFTAYRSTLSTTDIAAFAKTHPLFALTIPPAMINDGRYKNLLNLNTPVYTHTFNQSQEAAFLQEQGFSGVYTDYLLPLE